MSTITLPNVRQVSDITLKVKLKDDGVAIDWSGLSGIKAFLYSDVQHAISGRCTVAVDEEDSTILLCEYSGEKPQFLGVNRVVVQARYMGRLKTYDKVALNIVPRTQDLSGDTVTLDDPVVDVEISVEDVSSSILDNAIAAALAAAAHAEHAASLVPLQVLQDCEAATAVALTAASKAPVIGENGHWWVWNFQQAAYVDTGKQAKGDTGNGVASFSVVESEEDDADNVVTVTFTDGTTETFTVKNGKTGNGIVSIVQTVESPDDAGANEITVTMTDGTTATFRVKNGSKGTPGVANAKYKQVDTLPTAGAGTMDFIYLTPSGTSGVYNMSYTEQDGNSYTWKDLGTTAIQLSDYALKTEVRQLGQELNGGELLVNLQSGFYGSDLAYTEHPSFKCAKVDISAYRFLLVNLSTRGSAYISITDAEENILWQTNAAYYLKAICLDNYNSPKYLYVSNETANCPNPSVIANDTISEIKDAIKSEVIGRITIDKPGFIRYSSGEVSSSTTWNHSDFIEVGTFLYAYLRGHGSVASVAFYATKEFSSYLGGLQSAVNGWTEYDKNSMSIPAGAKYLVLSQETTFNGYCSYYGKTRQLDAEVTKLSDEVSAINRQGNIAKLAHFSFDDVHFSLEDITTNSGTYDSIFDNPFFAALRSLHDEYDMVFSLYVYTTTTASDGVTEWHLSDVSNKFVADFSNNSDWLKFGLHEGIYSDFVTQIIRITGSVNCIDTCPRFHGYLGTLSTCQSARDSDCGIIGLLGPDDTRVAYYLDATKSSLLYNRGKYFDATEQLYFFRTLKRLESQDPSITLNELLTKTGYNIANNAILFTHEYELYPSTLVINSQMLSKIETCGVWVRNNGYVWDYPMNKIRRVF